MTAILPLLEITAILTNKSGEVHALRLVLVWTGFKRDKVVGLIEGSLFVKLLGVITRKS